MQVIDTGTLGTRSAVIRLRRRGSSLHFVIFPMLHVATPEFYAEVTRRLEDCAVIVAEGISGRSVLTRALTMSYRVIPANRRLGLVKQDIDYAALGVPVIRPDVTGREFGRSWRTLPLWYRLLVWCCLPMIVLVQFFGGRKRLLAPTVVVDDEVTGSDFDDRVDEVFGGERDERVLLALAELHRTRSAERIDVAIVYGAAHVPALVQRLADTLGYRPRSADWITVVDW